MVKKDKDNKVISPEIEESVISVGGIQHEVQVFPSEVSNLNLNIDLNQNKEVSAMGFSLIERPARSSEKGKVLWEREVIKKDGQSGVEIRESWDGEVLDKREDGAVIPKVKESYEEVKEEVPENLTNQEEIVIRSSKWQTERNEFEEKLTIKFDKNISSRRLTEGGQVDFIEYQQIPPKK